MHFTTAEIGSFVGAYLWPLFRIGALVGAMPLIGTQFVPVIARLMLVLALTQLIAPTLPPPPAVDALSPEGLLITFNQVAIGVAMGFVLHIVFAAFVIGTQTVAMQVGLGFAASVDPLLGVQVPVLSTLYTLMTGLLFLVMEGHLTLIGLLAESFRQLPVGLNGISREGLWSVLVFSSTMFVGAIQFAIPAMAAMLIVNLAFGIVTRAAPQFNIFAVGMPIFMMMGFILLALTLPNLEGQLSELVEAAFQLIRELYGATGAG